MAAGLNRGARLLFHGAGGLRLVRWLHRKGLRILMYHRFPNAAGLDAQCRHIRKYYVPVSLSQVDSWLRCGGPLPPNAMAVTIDDGYRDFGDVAYPVLAAWQIPVTVYLVSDFLDGGIWLWVDQVRFAFANSPVRRFRTELPGGQVLEFALETPGQRRTAARETCEALKLQPDCVRVTWLGSMPEWLKISVPASPPVADAPLSWADVRRMANGIVTFGAHTRTHPVLSRVGSQDGLTREIEGSKRRIEEVLGRPVEHFCYPNGGASDITPECVEAVRRADFRTAVTTQTGLIHAGDDQLLLRRIGVEPDADPLYFGQCAAAFRV